MASAKNPEIGANATQTGEQCHREGNRAAAAERGDHLRRVQGADKCSGAPSSVEPAVSLGSGVKYALAERWCHHYAGNHRAQKKRPTDAEKNYSAVITEKMQTFAHLAPEALKLIFRRDDVGPQFFRPQHDVASLAHGEVTQEGDYVGGDVNQQHAAQADVVINESDDGSGDEESTLYPGKQKRIGVHELAPRREFLDQGGNRRPEHPEAGGDQCIHQVKLPDLHAVLKGEDGHCHNNHSAQGVEPHDQAAAILAVDDHSGKGQHEHGWQRLQNRKGAQCHFRMRGLQDVPGHGGRIHPAAHHGNNIGGEYETQRAMAEDGAHLSTLAEDPRIHHGPETQWRHPA